MPQRGELDALIRKDVDPGGLAKVNQLSNHSYEEIRETLIDILLTKENVAYPPNQFGNLTAGVAEVLARRSNSGQGAQNRHETARLHPADAELVRDVFWDLFRQGAITLGWNDSNSGWPFFRLSYFGRNTLASSSPYRFHDIASFISMVKSAGSDLLPISEVYLKEAVAAFYADCLLASCVMLGVAAESEFLRLIDAAVANGKFGQQFTSAQKAPFVRQKIVKFQRAVGSILGDLPQVATEDIETNFSAIQSILRIARNDAGHPSGAAPGREQVYVLLQLFAPYARQLGRLRKAFA